MVCWIPESQWALWKTTQGRDSSSLLYPLEWEGAHRGLGRLRNDLAVLVRF